MRRETYLFWAFWFIFLAIGGLSGTAVVVSTIARITDTQLVLESKAPRPQAVREVPAEFELYDDRSIIQTFTLPTDTYVSHIDVGFMNYRGAESGDVKVVLQNQQKQGIATASIPVTDLYSDDLTEFSLPAHLVAGEQYRLLVTTHGVSADDRLTPYYGLPGTGITVGQLSTTVETGEIRNFDGQLGFQIIQTPTWPTIRSRLVFSPALAMLGGYLLLLGIVASVAPVRRWLGKEVGKSLPEIVTANRISWQEVIGISLFAALLSFTVTAPFYTSLGRFDDMGDIQRALITRGLGKQAYLAEGKIAQWNPYLCGGIPLIENIESPHLGPTIIFSLLFGENLGLRVETTFMLAFGFVGAYLLARMFARTSPALSLLAASLFVFSGFQMLSFSSGVMVWLTLNWVPWFFLLVLKSLQRSEYSLGAGLILAAMLLSSGPHMPAFGILLAVIFLALTALVYRQLRPLLLMGVILSIGILVSAIKILPVLELNGLLNNFHRPPAYVAPLSLAPKMLWDRNQFATDSWVFKETGERYHWHEFGMYVGIIPVVLFFLGLPMYVRSRFWLVYLGTVVIFFLMTFGLFPWPILVKIPVLQEVFRTADRFRSVFLLLFGTLVAVATSYWVKKYIRHFSFRESISAVIAVAVTLDLVLVHAPLFPSLFNIDLVQLPQAHPFVRVDESYTSEEAYHVSYFNYLAGQGTRDLCLPNLGYGRLNAAKAVGDSEYVGEAYLPLQGQSASLEYVGPTHIDVSIPQSIDEPQLLVLNQNYFPGWRTDPEREVTRWRGLVAARIQPGDTHIRFIFEPLSFRIGSWVTLGAGVVMLILLMLLAVKKYQKT